jgi:hypothetical protein
MRRVGHHAAARVKMALLDRPWIVTDGTAILAYCHNETTATRVAELLDAHGLVDVPDTVGEVGE